MAITLKKITLWRKEIDNKPGAPIRWRHLHGPALTCRQ